MARIRVFLQVPSADAFELKAQALNNDPRLKAAGIAALKFVGDKRYIADGEFSPDVPPPTAPEAVLPSGETPEKSDSQDGERLRVVLRLLPDDAYELKAQALNNDPRLKAAGIAALKFESDKKFIVDGEFSEDLPPQPVPEPVPVTGQSAPTIGAGLRVTLRLLNKDAYELKAQALNDDPRLKDAGITALKFVGDKRYIVDGEFSEDLPSQPAERKPQPRETVHVYLRVPREDAYRLTSSFLNGDPRLKEAGIAGVGLVRGGGVAAPAPQPQKAVPRSGRLAWGVILAVAAILIGVGVVFGAPLLAPPPATSTPTATSAPTETSVPTATLTATPTAVVATKVQAVVPTITMTATPTPTEIVTCIPPQQGTILQQLNCRWGPGGVYIYRDGAYPGEQVQIIGRSDTAFGTWMYVQLPYRTPAAQCWISADSKYSDYEGDVSCLPPYYPTPARELRFSHPNFPPPSDVEAARLDTKVNIYWTVQSLAPGDRPDEGQPPYAPIYLIETWTCQAGKIVFTPLGYYTDNMSGTDTFTGSTSVVDEAGCAEPSHGRIFLAHKDGYVGPVEIPWP